MRNIFVYIDMMIFVELVVLWSEFVYSILINVLRPGALGNVYLYTGFGKDTVTVLMGGFNLTVYTRVVRESLVALVVPFDVVVALGVVRTTVSVAVGPPAVVVEVGLGVPAMGYSVQLEDVTIFCDRVVHLHWKPSHSDQFRLGWTSGLEKMCMIHGIYSSDGLWWWLY